MPSDQVRSVEKAVESAALVRRRVSDGGLLTGCVGPRRSELEDPSHEPALLGLSKLTDLAKAVER
jgi:hypothetical protein